MTPLGAVLRLARPRQWPILSFQLGVGAALAPGLTALRHAAPFSDGSAGVAWGAGGDLAIPLVGAWIAWVVLLNGGTLAFNSAYDRDSEPIAFLPAPPAPPRGLAIIALCAMGLAPLVGGWTVGPAFAALTATCVALSFAYSHPQLRWKSVPGLDLAVNVVGYGAGTTLAGWLAGRGASAAANPAPHGPPPFETAGPTAAAVPTAAGAWVGTVAATPPWALIAGFGLLFGSLYPLTQIYQIAADRRRGDRTLAAALGRDGSLLLAAALGLLAAGCLLAGAVAWRRAAYGDSEAVALAPLALALGLWLAHLGFWWRHRRRYHVARQRRGMYLALALWAGVDLGLLVALYWRP